MKAIVDGLAVVGMSARFPGAANVDQFRQNLIDGRESIVFLTDEELLDAAEERLFHAYGSLPEADQFDAGFFDMKPIEALFMDPQHRVLLECSWEALCDAGYVAGADGRRVGVFASSTLNEYSERVHARESFGITSLSTANDYLATRLAYSLNLRGPAVSVQCACSSAIAALKLAEQSLLNGEIDLALVAAACITVPLASKPLRDRGFSLDGHTRPFDEAGVGPLITSGAGAIVVRRAERALEDGDRTYAVVRGIAVGNDGSRKPVFYAPSAEGQAETIKRAILAAKIEPEDVGYIETHADGSIGDAVEIAALESSFSGCSKNSIGVGSVKGNIGHLINAAALASLIKGILTVRDGTIFASINFETPKAACRFGQTPFFVETKTRTWTGESRQAVICSYGFGGTSAVAVIENAPENITPNHIHRPLPLTISARTPAALRTYAERFATFLESKRDDDAYDIAFTTCVRRAHLAHRLIVVGTIDDWRRKLRAFTSSSSDDAPEEVAADDLPSFFTERGRVVSLPHYPWERKRYWLPPPADVGLESKAKEAANTSTQAILQRATSDPERLSIIGEAIRSFVAEIKGVPTQSITFATPLTQLGVDSIAVVNLRNMFERELGAHLSVPMLYAASNLTELATLILSRMNGPAATTPSSASSSSPLPLTIDPTVSASEDSLSIEELRALVYGSENRP